MPEGKKPWVIKKDIAQPMKKAIAHLRKSDPVLAQIIDQVGPPRMRYQPATFETVVRSIVFQQLSGRVARTIYERLATAATPLTESSVLRLRAPRMRGLGLSRQKIGYIRDLARKSRAGIVDFEKLPGLPDEEVLAILTQVKGIGIWTAQMFLLFALRRSDVLPIGDLGIRSAIKKAYELRELPSPDRIREIARPWHPYCSAASWYLWRSLDGIAGL